MRSNWHDLVAEFTMLIAQGYCNCGDRCSNQHFTKRQYVKLEKVSRNPMSMSRQLTS